MNTKKVVSLFSLMAMLLTLLSGCSLEPPFDIPFLTKEPTSQELLAGVLPVDTKQYYDFSVSAKYTGKTGGAPVEMTISMSMEGNDKIAHIYDTSMSIGTEGMSFDISMESWGDSESKMTYTRGSFFGQDTGWQKSAMKAEEAESANSIAELPVLLTGLGADNIEPDLQEHEKGTDYVLTWQVPIEEFKTTLQSMVSKTEASEGSVISTESMDFGDIQAVNVKATFAEEDQLLKFVEVGGSGTETSMNLVVNLKSVNKQVDKVLSVPSDVVSTATEKSEDDAGFDFSGAFGDDSLDTGTGNTSTIDMILTTDISAPVFPESGILGEPIYSDTVAYSNDGEGYDEILDGVLVPKIMATDANPTIDVTHTEDVSVLSYTYSAGSWYGSLYITHVTTDDPLNEIATEYAQSFDYYLGMYGENGLLLGSKEESAYAFGASDGVSTALSYSALAGDYYVEVYVVSDGVVSMDNCAQIVNGLLSIAGIRQS